MCGKWAEGLRRRAGGWKVELALAFLAIVVLGPIVARDSAQPASRLALTAALAEHHTVDLSGYPLGVDRAMYNGHLRSDKAPGQPIIAVPVYVVAKVFGAESAVHRNVDGNLTLWFITFSTASVPFALLLVLMYREAWRVAPEHAVAATLAVGLGGMLVPYATNLFGHVLGAFFAFAGWCVLEPGPEDRRRLVGAGALIGAAVFVEYHAAVVAIVVLAYAVTRARRGVGWLIAGAAPFALALAWYQWRAFGAPWRLPFGYYAGMINGTTEGGYTVSGVRGFADVLTGSHGLLLNAPLVLFAAAGAFFAARTTTGTVQRGCVVSLAIFVPLLVLVAGWSGTPTSETPGPRYLAPAIPFLVVPVAVLWDRFGRLFTVAALIGFASGMAASFISINTPMGATPWREYLPGIKGPLEPTVWSTPFGAFGWLLYFALAAVAVWHLVRVTRHAPDLDGVLVRV